MMSGNAKRCMAGISLAAMTVASAALAQQTETPPAATPAVPAPVTPPAATPASPPAPAVQPTAPAATTAPATPSATTVQPATPQQTVPPEGGAPQLPEVQIIQEQPKPQPPPQPAPKVVEKKKPAPQPEPPAPVAKAKPKAKPQQQQAAQPAPQPEPQPPAEPVEAAPAPLSTEVKMSPVGGSEIPIAKVPGSVGRATAQDIQRTGSIEPQNVLETNVPGVIVTDLQGNGFQTNVQYRGFESSPVNGVPQGLAVYQNGVRINEPFGDIVNWDFIPSVAINDITVVAGNPVFGLNAIGGAISIGMKDGFNYQGTEIDTRFGSFGRYQGSLQTGQRSGAFAAYLALEGAHDDGWRDFSESEVKRMYADLGFKTEDAELHVNFTGAKNSIGVVAASPVELLDLDWARTFTSPQTTDNEVKMVSLNGSVSVTNTLKLSGVAYRRRFTQSHIDGNILEAEDCGDGTLCLEGEQAEGPGGPIPFDIADPLASLDTTTQDSKGEGVSVQAVEKSPLFGLGNQFLVGASYDHGKVLYTASSALGALGDRFVVSPLGIPLVAPDDVSPRRLTTENDYYGLYFSDTLDLTDQLSVTVGGRYNVADLSIRDLTGNDPFLNADSKFRRFNPMAGATYTFVPGLTLYGSYSEANRAPTPAELACSDENNPCLIESFLTADPPLKQVISKTAEIGLRGETLSWNGREKLTWSAGLFRTLNTDDIISVAAQTSGRGFFQNAGDTLRQGVEAAASYRTDRYYVYANYSFTDATFRTPLELASPNNPSAEVCTGADPTDPEAPTCVNVEKGDRLPGVARHKFKAGFDYWVTPRWRFGADLIASSNQIFTGDEGNDQKPLGGYAKVNLHTSYDITDHIQVYGLIDNLFDTHYGLFGNFFNTEQASEASLGTIDFTDPRTIVPAAPFAIYGGLKVKF